MRTLLEELNKENEARSKRLNSGMVTELGRAVIVGEYNAVLDIIRRMENE